MYTCAMSHFVYGVHAIKALILSTPDEILNLSVVASDVSRYESLLSLAEEKGLLVHKLSKKAIDEKIGQSVVHQNLVAECKRYTGLSESAFWELLDTVEHPQHLLVCDGVQDPHNLGAILRSANAFGVLAVIAPKDRSVGLNATVAKVSCGAAFMTPFVQVTNLAQFLKKLKSKDFWIVGLDEHTETVLSDVDMSGSMVMVMGNEGQGIRKLTKQHCDYLAKITLPGEIKSLNVASATTCALYELSRQRAK